MNRKELLQSPKIDPNDYKEIDKLISIIEEKLDMRSSVKEEIALIHKVAKKRAQYEEDHFKTYWSSMSKDDFIKEILAPIPPKIKNITHKEIYSILVRMFGREIEFTQYYLSLLEKSTQYKYGLSDLIYWPNELGYPINLELREIAKIIFENEIPPSKKHAELSSIAS